MPISIIVHHLLLLPAAALLHFGQWAISRRLTLAHCPKCWVPPTHPLKSALPYSSQIIDFVLLHIPLLVKYVNS